MGRLTAEGMAAMVVALNSEIRRIPYVCPNCDAELGELVLIDGVIWLDNHDWLVRDGRKHCHRCGRLVHIKPAKDSWDELARRYLERLAKRRQMQEVAA